MSIDDVQRMSITVRGAVQGVGFRPFVHRLATGLELRGVVRNRNSGVDIDIEGREPALRKFLESLRADHPPLAVITDVATEMKAPSGFQDFTIAASETDSMGTSPASDVVVPADTATCASCLTELFDPKNRRFRYPFINCVDCGPRFTIIKNLPYDRPFTTMSHFIMCDQCRREYEDPAHRRFHAQPNACFACGPRLSIFDRLGTLVDCDDPVAFISDKILRGHIVAIKGLGGYHIACDARAADVVAELRARKRRDTKPLAVMLANSDLAVRYGELSSTERELLEGPGRPIVLVDRRSDAIDSVCEEVCAGSPRLGMMLPYTPVHHLLMKAVGEIPVVMTSGNDSDQPMAYSDEDAFKRLGSVADFFLSHDRAIHARCDDTVVRVARESGEPRFIRRARGFAPETFRLPFSSRRAVLACGAQLKNTFALSENDRAIMSHHVGDLDEFMTYRLYRSEIRRTLDFFKLRPGVIAHDLHPDYVSSHFARELSREMGVQLRGVQHHHAHIASCMVENQLRPGESVIGVACDGTGYGLDGKIWGGEFLICRYSDFERAGHLKYVPMPSGERAISEPWRMAYSHLLRAVVDPEIMEWPCDRASRRFFERLVTQKSASPETSSMGRLFDAVSAILGVRDTVSYEGQAAVELEWLASRAPEQAVHAWDFLGARYGFRVDQNGGPFTVDPAPLLRAIIDDLNLGCDRALLAWRFHESVAQMITECCELIRLSSGLNKVALSGGVFLNALLEERTCALLRERRFEVFCHQVVPCHDGGLSLGQLAVAVAQAEV